MKKFILVLSVLLLPVMAFAQEVAQAVVAPVVDLAVEVPVQDLLSFLLKSMGGMKGASTIAIVAVALQGLLLAFRTRLLDKFAGKYKLMIVYSLSMIAGIVALMSQGVDIQTALVHSNSMAAYQVFFHQIMKHVSEKKNDQKA